MTRSYCCHLYPSLQLALRFHRLLHASHLDEGRSDSTRAKKSTERGLMKKSLIGLCLVLAPSLAWCKSNKTMWENLNALQPGEKIQLFETDHRKISGAFVSVNSNDITINEKSGNATVERGDIARVLAGGQRLRHLSIGVGIGAGAGAAIGGVTYNPHNVLNESRGANMGAGAIVGIAVGAVVGGFMSDFKTVYQANGR